MFRGYFTMEPAPAVNVALIWHFSTIISALFKKLTDLSRPIDVSRLLRFLILLQVISDLTNGLQVFIQTHSRHVLSPF
jgi:hypothetical protein